jgi:hypothetical protein
MVLALVFRVTIYTPYFYLSPWYRKRI